MTRLPLVLALVIACAPAGAQSLMRRVLDGDGSVQFIFAARPGVCGDGANFISDGFGGNNRIYVNGNFGRDSRDNDWPPCAPGPVRVVASVSGGEIVRLRTYAGPLRSGDSPRRDLGVVSVSEATDFLTRLIEQAHGRAANDAVLPFMLADSITPWPSLLRSARDEQLPRGLRSNIAFWLARGASAKLGLIDRGDDDDDEVRSSAVFALSQQPKETAIPELIDVARHAPHPASRAQALFWLGQSGDRRAIDLFDEILRRR